MNIRIHNLIMSGWSRPLFSYKKDGIYIERGPLKGINISEKHSDGEPVIEYLERLLENDDISYKWRYHIKEVIKDLLDDY